MGNVWVSFFADWEPSRRLHHIRDLRIHGLHMIHTLSLLPFQKSISSDILCNLVSFFIPPEKGTLCKYENSQKPDCPQLHSQTQTVKPKQLSPAQCLPVKAPRKTNCQNPLQLLRTLFSGKRGIVMYQMFPCLPEGRDEALRAKSVFLLPGYAIIC